MSKAKIRVGIVGAGGVGGLGGRANSHAGRLPAVRGS